MARDTEQFRSEDFRTELKMDAVANGDVLVEIRSHTSIVVHTLSHTEAVSLMEWLTIATA